MKTANVSVSHSHLTPIVSVRLSNSGRHSLCVCSMKPQKKCFFFFSTDAVLTLPNEKNPPDAKCCLLSPKICYMPIQFERTVAAKERVCAQRHAFVLQNFQGQHCTFPPHTEVSKLQSMQSTLCENLCPYWEISLC